MIGHFRGISVLPHKGPPAPLVLPTGQPAVAGMPDPIGPGTGSGASCYRTEVLADDPEVYWRFDTAEGDSANDVQDVSGNGHTAVDTASTFDTHSSEPFDTEEYLADAAFVYANSDDSPALEPDTGGITLIAWGFADVDTNLTNAFLIHVYGRSFDSVIHDLAAITWTQTGFTTGYEGTLAATLYTGAAGSETPYSVAQVTNFPEPVMARLVLRWDGTTLDLLVDDTTVASDTPGGSWTLITGLDPDQSYLVGGEGDESDPGTVQLDELHYHLAALSDARLDAQYAARLVRCP